MDPARRRQALLATGDAGALNQLTHSLLDTSVSRPEGWIAGSFYMQARAPGGARPAPGCWIPA